MDHARERLLWLSLRHRRVAQTNPLAQYQLDLCIDEVTSSTRRTTVPSVPWWDRRARDQHAHRVRLPWRLPLLPVVTSVEAPAEAAAEEEVQPAAAVVAAAGGEAVRRPLPVADEAAAADVAVAADCDCKTKTFTSLVLSHELT